MTNYKVNESYSPFDIPGLSAHRGHGSAVYRGINNGALEFRCDGCSDTVFVVPAGIEPLHQWRPEGGGKVNEEEVRRAAESAHDELTIVSANWQDRFCTKELEALETVQAALRRELKLSHDSTP